MEVESLLYNIVYLYSIVYPSPRRSFQSDDSNTWRITKKSQLFSRPAGESVGNFVAAIGGMKGFLARKGPAAPQ
jgi:hypothetical protein